MAEETAAVIAGLGVGIAFIVTVASIAPPFQSETGNMGDIHNMQVVRLFPEKYPNAIERNSTILGSTSQMFIAVPNPPQESECCIDNVFTTSFLEIVHEKSGISHLQVYCGRMEIGPGGSQVLERHLLQGQQC